MFFGAYLLTYQLPTPHELGLNGSFVAFRILQQDVDGFEEFLNQNSPKINISTEKLAAKICDRWRNGVLSPKTDSPDPLIAPDQMNNFDYVTSSDNQYDFSEICVVFYSTFNECVL